MSNINADFAIRDIIKLLKAINMSQQYIDIIIRANRLAYIQHNGQKRESGEPYIIHPQSVARILVKEMNCHSPNAIATAFLHDVVEDCETMNIELLANLFNKDTAKMVDGVTKIHKLNFNSLTEADDTNLKKLLFYSIMGNIAILLIKFADRLHNMRTLHHKKEEYKQLENASETLIYVNLAHWLGIEWLSQELKDLSYQYLHPKYLDFKKEVKQHIKGEEENIALMKKQVSTLLGHSYKVSFHTKSMADLYDEFNLYKDFNNIHDTKQIRIIGHNVEDCYRILDLINQNFNDQKYPHKKKDYISDPKSNLYQALHTTITGPNGSTFQIQIMTEDMNNTNNNGITRFWDNKNKMQEVFDEKFGFFKNFLKDGIIALAEDDNYGFNNNYNETFRDSIYVYTERGQRKFFPKGATIIDYAYERYADAMVNNKLEKVLVNGGELSIFSPISNHDIIKLVFCDDATSDKCIGPNEEWLLHCSTKKAKNGIASFLATKEKSLTLAS